MDSLRDQVYPVTRRSNAASATLPLNGTVGLQASVVLVKVLILSCVS